MYKYSKVYVIAPYQIATGGVELSHQLVDFLRKNAINAYIVYVSENKIVTDAEIIEVYKKYNILTADAIEDVNNNILILPEIFFDWIFQYNCINLGCWWMSVDNYYRYCSLYQRLLFNKGIRDKLRTISSYFKKPYKNKISDLRIRNERITHFYQSHYAQNHLYSQNLSTILPLSDYINTELITANIDLDKKEDIILYNPVKGGEFVDSLKSQLKGYEIVPLQELSRSELLSLFKRAKLYIDFGHHPGKDRMPREAAANFCCVITSKSGAASFYEDIPILDKYKFDINKSSRDKIAEQIKWVLNNYGSSIDDFSFYRKQILNEKEIFHAEIINFFM